MVWLLESRVKAAIEHAEATGYTPSAEQRAEFSAISQNDGGIFSVAGDQAEVRVEGVLTKQPSFLAWLFGGGNATYKDIADSLAQAQADPQVKNISMRIDSPGGNFDGLFIAIAAMQSVTKPITAYVEDLAASAAFALAANADRIVVRDKSTRVGSIGVVAGFMTDDDMIEITSTQAPKKRPDPTTADGIAAIREEIDAMHDLFVDTIATGRGTTPANVNATFGMGACFLAEKALELGMIDAIGEQTTDQPATTPTANSGINHKLEIKTMDLAELKVQHPATYAAAVQEGTAQERDRVTAHVTMGEASGDIKTALTAIQDGSAMTGALSAKYMAASMNRGDVNARQQDEVPAVTTDANAGADTAAQQVAALVAKKSGVK